MTRTRWIIFVVICISILGLVFWSNKQTVAPFKGDASKIITDGPIGDHVFGLATSKVLLIEYGDFQCPACGSMFPYVKQIKEQYKDRIAFVFRDMPLTSIHPNALAAATVAEAAGLQNKFYEMHDLLYQNQSSWSSTSGNARTAFFEGLAKQLNLDINKFRNDLDSSDITQKITRDRSTSNVFAVDSTPTFVLNGQKLSGVTGSNGDKLKKAVDDALNGQ
ncbi:MAG TPA: thioredoxin domain-containing protein [Patescibacteria group bacterium]|jgi:protein-disulfide isomerase|nr:thioredoxin domain-containing protein [Patescibacteria group bacterium]